MNRKDQLTPEEYKRVIHVLTPFTLGRRVDDQEIENDYGCFHLGKRPKRRKNYQPDLYYYWDAPIEEDYDWRDKFPNVDCMCEVCFDIANKEKKIKWQLPRCQTHL